jgi:hypothetical protein
MRNMRHTDFNFQASEAVEKARQARSGKTVLVL